jgi:hypothetical protein
MGNRLSKIATRTGDSGTTGLGNNQRVSKTACVCTPWAMWTSSTATLVCCCAKTCPPAVRELLVEVQHQLFNLGGGLSIPGFELLKADAVLALDQALAVFNEPPSSLQEFILPAGTRAAVPNHSRIFRDLHELASAGQFDGQDDHHTPEPYVRQAFLKYLECGIFAHGFARAWCDDCDQDYFVAYS